MSGGPGDGEPVRVFISYAYESDEHVAAVRDLWVFLRSQGIDARLDLPEAERRQEWPSWMLEQVRDARYVLVVASPAYKRHSEGVRTADDRRGVQFESRLIREFFYRDQAAGMERFLPVLLPGVSVECIPEFLSPAFMTYYRVDSMTVAGCEALLRVLTGQPYEVEPPLGPVPVLAPRAPERQPAREPRPADSAPSFPVGSTVRATQKGDLVECSVFAPPMVAPGSTFMIQAFAHTSSHTREAIRRAKEFDSDAVRRAIKTLESSVPRGTKLSFHLTVPGLRVDDQVQSLVWWGATECVQFGVSAPRQCRPGNVVGTLTVSQDWIPIGHIKFTLTIATAPKLPPSSMSAVGETARRYEMAFISYASEDRTTVLERVQVLPTVGIRTFQDVLNLEPGERWEHSLYRHIDESDIVLLFWSNAAKKSKWVRKEVQYALDHKHGDEFAPPEIGPVIIEGPPVPRPWKELAYLHFNDPRIYLMGR